MTDREAYVKALAEEMLTVKEFAAVTREHVESVRRRIRQGRQPGAHRLGGQWRINVTECCVLLSSRQVLRP